MHTVFADTEVYVAAGGITGRASLCNLLSLCDLITDCNQKLGIVTVQRRNSAAVIDDNIISVAVVVFGNDDGSRICRSDGSGRISSSAPVSATVPPDCGTRYSAEDIP